jgi:hypothetical protein
MNLLTYLLAATARWGFVFPQERSLQRAVALAFGILCGVGRRTLTRAISFQGNTQKDWSADYSGCSCLSNPQIVEGQHDMDIVRQECSH